MATNLHPIGAHSSPLGAAATARALVRSSAFCDPCGATDDDKRSLLALDMSANASIQTAFDTIKRLSQPKLKTL
jgi:hypothetical protein